MRNKFEQQLETLNVELIKMGALCEEAIASAIKALLEGDAAMAEKTYETDTHIDEMEREIESLCMKLLLQQQPVARDLRVISSALKMISDMERIGDQAEDIAEITKTIKRVDEDCNKLIGQMASAAVTMVTESIDSFVKKDMQLVRRVIESDDIVDDYFIRIKDYLIALVAKSPSEGEYYLDLLMIVKYLERIADHATNIAEWVEFSITGKHGE